jgi:hypothetical protein
MKRRTTIRTTGRALAAARKELRRAALLVTIARVRPELSEARHDRARGKDG